MVCMHHKEPNTFCGWCSFIQCHTERDRLRSDLAAANERAEKAEKKRDEWKFQAEHNGVEAEHMRECAETAEAEVERLRTALTRIADPFCAYPNFIARDALALARGAKP